MKTRDSMSDDNTSPDSTERPAVTHVIGGVDGYPAFYFRPLTADEQAALAEQRRKAELDELAKQQRHKETLEQQSNAFEEFGDDDDDEPRTPDDPDKFRDAINAVARRIFGEPNRKLSKGDEMRYNARGSLCVFVSGPRKGTWADYETGEGGGCLDLVIYGKQARDRAEAAVWCEQRGYIPKSGNASKPKKKEKRTHGDRHPKFGKPVTTYPYRDADGVLLYEGCRLIQKLSDRGSPTARALGIGI
jgi:hypothetical protein